MKTRKKCESYEKNSIFILKKSKISKSFRFENKNPEKCESIFNFYFSQKKFLKNSNSIDFRQWGFWIT